MSDTSSAAAPKLRWTLSRKILSVLAGVGVGLLIIAVTSYRSVGTLSASSGMVDHTYRVLTQIADISSSLTDAETGQRGFLITGKQHYLAPYQKAQQDLAVEQQALRELTADNPAQHKRLDALAPLVQSKLSELKETIDLRSSAGGFDAALKVVLTDKGKAVMDQIRTVLNDMSQQETVLWRSAATPRPPQRP